MATKHYCVLDRDNIFRGLRLARETLQDNGATIVMPIPEDSLQEGEHLLDAWPPSCKQYAGDVGFVRPKWDGQSWTEGATPEELADFDQSHTAPLDLDLPARVEALEARNTALARAYAKGVTDA